MRTKILTTSGTQLLLDRQPFRFQGLSFFNALFNPTFNYSPNDRKQWLRIYKTNGINCLRVWCQWDFDPPHTFVDTAPENSLFHEDGQIRASYFANLEELLSAADELGMVIQVTLFSHEKQPNLSIAAQERAVAEMTERLLPYRHVLLQIWNEDSTEVQRYFRIIKRIDPERVVTNSPGFGGDLGDDTQNEMLDVLTPHTSRIAGPFWEVATGEISSLIEKFGKPVIDDEPARCGIMQFGGISGGTSPDQHIRQIQMVRSIGGYSTYHHDMFQLNYGNDSTPHTGIPDPDFSAFHRQVFDFLRATS